MSAYSTLYNTIFKRNSVFVGAIMFGAFAFEGFFDSACTRWYENHNKGKLWKDIKAKYTAGEEDVEDE